MLNSIFSVIDDRFVKFGNLMIDWDIIIKVSISADVPITGKYVA